MKILLMEDLGCSAQLLEDNIQKLKSLGHEFIVCNGDMKKIREECGNANVLMLANMPLKEEIIQEAPELKFIDVAFTGVDHIPMTLAKSRDLIVSNASGYSNDAVAELCLCFMIELLRDLPEAEKRLAEGKTKKGLRANQLKGKTVGIIGAGAIGKRVAALCKAFGAKVIAHNRHMVNDPAIDENTDLDTLLEISDIITVHCPLTDKTRKMLGKKEFEKMKKSAFLINAGRGPILDNEALAEALNNNVISGAALDVFDEEPPLKIDNPLLSAKNVILTPHLAFYTEESLEERARIAFQNLYAFLSGTPQNLV